jgi:hypothetical protein
MDALQLYIQNQKDKGYPLHNLERWYSSLQEQRAQERAELERMEDRLKSCLLFILRTNYRALYVEDLASHDFNFLHHFATDDIKDKFEEIWPLWKP